MKYVKENTKTKGAGINLNAMDSKSEGNKYSKYFAKYVPDVKNWSNRDEVSDAFLDKFAGKYAKDAKKEKDETVDNLHATSQSSDKPSSEPPALAASESVASSQGNLDAASQNSTDAQDVPVGAASLSAKGAQKSTRVLFIIPAAFTAGGVMLLHIWSKSRRHPFLDPLLEAW